MNSEAGGYYRSGDHAERLWGVERRDPASSQAQRGLAREKMRAVQQQQQHHVNDYFSAAKGDYSYGIQSAAEGGTYHERISGRSSFDTPQARYNEFDPSSKIFSPPAQRYQEGGAIARSASGGLPRYSEIKDVHEERGGWGRKYADGWESRPQQREAFPSSDERERSVQRYAEQESRSKLFQDPPHTLQRASSGPGFRSFPHPPPPEREDFSNRREVAGGYFESVRDRASEDYRPRQAFSGGGGFNSYSRSDGEKNWRRDKQQQQQEEEHIVYESELLGEDPTNDDFQDLPPAPTHQDAAIKRESGWGSSNTNTNANSSNRSTRGRGRGGMQRPAHRGAAPPRKVEVFRSAEHREILKQYRKCISVPDACTEYVIGRQRYHLNIYEEKFKHEAEFEVAKQPEKDERGIRSPAILEIFAINEEVLRRAESMIHLRISEGLTSRQPGYYFTVVDLPTPHGQFTRYIGEEYNKSEKSYILEAAAEPSETQVDPNAVVRPKDTRPWRPPTTHKKLPYDVGVAGQGTTPYVALKKHPQMAFQLMKEQMTANLRSSFKVFARLGKMIFDSKQTNDFPRAGQMVKVGDVGKVLTKDLARVRFITTIPYTPVSRLHHGYMRDKGYKLVSITRKIAVHYFNGLDRLIATFHVPSPSVSSFSSDSVTSNLRYETPILSKVKIENHRLLMTNYARDSEHIDYRLSSISAIAQSSEEHDDVIHIIASAWATRKPTDNDEEMTLQLPLAYRNLNLHIVRYKTNEKYTSTEEGLTIKLTKLVQDEVSNGQWLSVSNYKKLQAQQATAKELDCPLCDGMFRDPCTVPCCGESYCRECMQDKSTCPSCQQKTSPDRLVPNKKLEKLVDELKKLTAITPSTDASLSATLVSPPVAKSKWEVTVWSHKWRESLKAGMWDVDGNSVEDVPAFMEKVKEIADACGNPFK